MHNRLKLTEQSLPTQKNQKHRNHSTLFNSPMASTSLLFIFISILFLLPSSLHSATVVEDLINLRPPPDFNSTIISNCLHNPSLRYCNTSSSSSSTPMNLNEIFRFTIVASHLCNESKNPNCIESFPKIDLRSRPKIAPLYLSFSFFWKYCPLTIQTIDFSNNSLKGGFPEDVLFCTQIHGLDFSRNRLSGDVPVERFSQLTNLTVLNLSCNHFTEVSDSEFLKRFSPSSFVDSGLLPSRPSYKIKAVVLLIGFPIGVILMVWLCRRRFEFIPELLRGSKHKFTPSMLKAATNGFSRHNLIGERDGVSVYKGVLRNKTEVRIQVYQDETETTHHHHHQRKNHEKFLEDCNVLVQLRHENLVRVLGWCNDQSLKAVVTERTNGDNVEMWLSRSAPPLKHRVKVLIGVLQGMIYLQENWPQIGYDLRTSSVLFSDNQEPLISRFKVGDHSNKNKNKNTGSIYKFGLFLLEMITNQESKGHERNLIEHVRMKYHDEELEMVIDERMKLSENGFVQVKKGIGLGLMCIDESTSKHPSLDQISYMIKSVYESCLERRSHGDGVGFTHNHCSKTR